MQVAGSCHELLRPAACDELSVTVFRHRKRATRAWCLGSRTKTRAGKGLALSRMGGESGAKAAAGKGDEQSIASDENTKDQQVAESEAKKATPRRRRRRRGGEVEVVLQAAVQWARRGQLRKMRAAATGPVGVLGRVDRVWAVCVSSLHQRRASSCAQAGDDELRQRTRKLSKHVAAAFFFQAPKSRSCSQQTRQVHATPPSTALALCCT
jgi:hypothetical protein